MKPGNHLAPKARQVPIPAEDVFWQIRGVNSYEIHPPFLLKGGLVLILGILR